MTTGLKVYFAFILIFMFHFFLAREASVSFLQTILISSFVKLVLVPFLVAVLVAWLLQTAQEPGPPGKADRILERVPKLADFSYEQTDRVGGLQGHINIKRLLDGH